MEEIRLAHAFSKLHVVTDVALKLLASLLGGAGDGQFESGEVLDVECLVEVTLRVDRYDFVLVIEVVEFDDLREFLGIEGLSGEAE